MDKNIQGHLFWDTMNIVKIGLVLWHGLVSMAALNGVRNPFGLT
jgi:hypothetical protein